MTPPPVGSTQLSESIVSNQPGDYFSGCRNVEDVYELIRRIGDGTYGTVYKARNRFTGQLVALKRVKLENEKEGFPLISLREIKVLMQSTHPNIGALKYLT